MTGRVEWGADGVTATATLNADRTFTVAYRGGPLPTPTADPALAASLADQCRDAHAGPSDGRYGVAFLHALARRFGGTTMIIDVPPGDPGVAY